MKALLSFLRIPPVFDSLVVFAVLGILWFVWPQEYRDMRLLGLSLVVLLGAVWIVVDTVRYLLVRERMRKQPRGHLRERLDDAYRALVMRCQMENTFSREDAALSLPWIVLTGKPKCGKSEALRQGDFELVHECRVRPNDDEVVCSVWLSQVYGKASGTDRHRVVVWEVSGSLSDRDAGDELLAWLAYRRERLDGLVVMVAADELVGGDIDGAKRSARQLSVLLGRATKNFPGKLSASLILSKCDLIDGFVPFFAGLRLDEQQVCGFSGQLGLRRGLQALLKSLNGRITQRLAEIRAPGDCEAILTFPWEVESYGALSCTFSEELAIQVQGIGIEEVYLCSARPSRETAPSLRRKQVPWQPPVAQQSGAAKAYFLDGMFNRMAHLGSPGQAGRQRHWPMLLGSGLTTVALIAVMGYFAISRYAKLDSALAELSGENPETLRGAYARLMEWDASRGFSLVPSSNRESVLSGLRQQLDRDRLVGVSADAVMRRLTKLTWDERQSSALKEGLERLRHCRTAARLVQPLLQYREANNKDPLAQPLYKDLMRLSQDQDRDAMRRGFEVLKAASLLNADGKCKPPKDYVEWITHYFSQLWFRDKNDDEKLQKELETHLLRFFSQYLKTSDGKPYPRLRLNEGQYNDLILKKLRSRFSSSPGMGDYPIIWTMMLTEALPESEPQGLFHGSGLPLRSRVTIPIEYTAAGCRDIVKFYEKVPKDQGSPEVAWLPCALKVDLAETPLADLDLWKYYRQEHIKTWQNWLNQIEIQRPLNLDLAARELQALPTQLDQLFARIGLGEQGEERELVRTDCKEALGPYAPFRWVNWPADKSPAPEVGNAYMAYRRQLVDVQVQLAQLNQVSAPREGSELLKATGSLAGLEASRRAFMDALKSGGPAITTRLRVDKLDATLGSLEEALWELVLLYIQKAIGTQWQTVYTSWEDQRKQPVADAAAAKASQEQLATLLKGFRTSYVLPFGNLRTCIPDSSVNGLPSQRAVLCPEVCRTLNDKIDATLRLWKPQPVEVTPAMGVNPTLVGDPDFACGGSSVIKVRLDTKEMQAKYTCYLLQNRECRPEGTTEETKATLEVMLRDQKQYEPPLAASRVSFRRLVLDLLPKDRHGNPSMPVLEVDPRTSTQRVPVRFPVETCPGKTNLKMYLDQQLVQFLIRGPSGPGEPPWLQSGFLPQNLVNCPPPPRHQEKVR